jgi:hypothetical protein
VHEAKLGQVCLRGDNEQTAWFPSFPLGIKANPEKIKAIKAVWPPARIKDVQKLTGCFTALSRFISRLVEWALTFFKLLQKSRSFVWTEEVEEAFQELKQYLTSPLIMVAPEPGEPLVLYIVATADVVSMVLVAERLEPHQHHEPEAEEATGSQPQDARPALKPCDGANTPTEHQLPEANLGLDSQVAIITQLPGPFWTLGAGAP